MSEAEEPDGGASGRGASLSPPPARAPRRRGPLRRAVRAATPRLARAATSVLWATCRLETSGTEALDALAREGRPFIACYWHGHQIFCVRALLALRERRPAIRLGYLISPSRDGDDAARLFAGLDLHVIRGSATRGGAQAMREIYLAVRTDGVCPIITPDGPTGPARRVKPGVALLASLAGAPVVPLAMAARPAAALGSWDAATLPAPFARVHVRAGEPIRLARGLDEAATRTACERIETALEGCADEATRRLDRR